LRTHPAIGGATGLRYIPKFFTGGQK
jgi:hypothetical protein